MRDRVAYAAALVLDLLGGGIALLVSTRGWQTVLTHRPPPLGDTVLTVSGRTIDSASTALAVVALAGVVAVLATRGVARRVIGMVLAVAGVAMIWRSLAATTELSTRRAQALVAARHPGIPLISGTHVTVHPVWPILSAISGALVVAGGAALAVRGHRWANMSAKYEAPDASRDAARSDATLWAALERGEDPTAGKRSVEEI
jgi:uncharacterized membrane protein (TIGR02234 family)